MKTKILLILAVIILSTSNIFSQNTSSTPDKYSKFSLYSNRPTIELSYGLSDIKLSGENPSLSNAGMIEMKLGFTRERNSKYGKEISNYRNSYLFLGFASSDNYAKSDNPGIESDMWRFGLGSKSGYGVKLGSISIMPYNSNSFSWSKFDYNQELNESAALNDFDEAFRFGSTTEAGINLQLARGFSIQPKYEIADIYPRHLFGKQLMSTVIEAVGLMAVDGFTKAIMKNSPVAGTFVNFILKNAYEYGFYQLRKTQMNWPFTSVAPLRYNTFKLGMTFVF